MTGPRWSGGDVAEVGLAFGVVESALGEIYKQVTVRCRVCEKKLEGWRWIKTHAIQTGHAGVVLLKAHLGKEAVEALNWLHGTEGSFWIEAAGINEKLILEGTRELAESAKVHPPPSSSAPTP